MDTISQDIRSGFRFLWRSPGFTVTVVTVLALGIGATTAIFTAVDTVLLKPMAVHEPDRLMALWEWNPEKGWAPEDEIQVAPANALDWREQVDGFEDVAMFNEFVQDVVLTGQGDPVPLGAGVVTGNWFEVLGVQPTMGRGFTWNETWAGGDRTVVLSHGLWERAFGSDPEILGRVLTVDGRAFQVIGVTSAEYRHPVEPVDMYVPYNWDRANREAVWFRRAHLARGVARLAPGVSQAEATAQLEAVAARLEQDHPETNRLMGAGMTPLQRHLTGDARQPLLFLLGAVGVLLVLACVNVGNLLLVRGVGREREMAVRSALGAGRRRLIRQVFSESMTVSLVGGAIGFGLGLLGLRLFGTFAPPDLPDLARAFVQPRAVVFAVTVTVLCGLLFGAIAAVRGTRTPLTDSLKEGSRAGTSGAQALRAVHMLVSAEVALALMLVLGAGLLARSLWSLRSVDPGFDGSGVMTFALEPNSTYDTNDETIAIYQEMEGAIAAVPGVREVGGVRALPLTGRQWSSDFTVEGRPPGDYIVEVNHREATAGYYTTLRVPLLAGRLYESQDQGEAPLVVVVNQALVDVAFPDGESPIGQRVSFDRNPTEDSYWWTIIGVVANERYSPRAEPMPEIVAHAYQDAPGALRYVVRADLEPSALVAAVRQTLKRIDPDLVLTEIRTMDDVKGAALLRERFLTSLLGVFASVALLLAAVGVYGVSAQMARRRTREIGIRMALGADASQVMGMVVRRGMGLTLAGIAIGLVAALAASRLMAGLLYGVEPVDGPTYVMVPVLLGLAALVACLGPARRATRVDPVSALKTE
jgi:putative ABC transport system permease protein